MIAWLQIEYQSSSSILDMLQQMISPTNVSDVRFFLGMVNQLAKFAGDVAEQSAPIRDLLRKDPGWSWDVVHQMAFDRIKKTVVSAPLLALYTIQTSRHSCPPTAHPMA